MSLHTYPGWGGTGPADQPSSSRPRLPAHTDCQTGIAGPSRSPATETITSSQGNRFDSGRGRPRVVLRGHLGARHPTALLTLAAPPSPRLRARLRTYGSRSPPRQSRAASLPRPAAESNVPRSPGHRAGTARTPRQVAGCPGGTVLHAAHPAGSIRVDDQPIAPTADEPADPRTLEQPGVRPAQTATTRGGIGSKPARHGAAAIAAMASASKDQPPRRARTQHRRSPRGTATRHRNRGGTATRRSAVSRWRRASRGGVRSRRPAPRPAPARRRWARH